MARIAAANVTTGYVVRRAEGELFNSYIEANVHAPQIFEVFRKLVFGLLPEVAAPLVGMKDEEPVFGPYTDRALALAVFETHVDLLQNDGFLEFGMLHQSELAFEEVFVASPKYFEIWTNNEAAARDILNSASVPECESLEFIDQYPMVSKSVDKKGDAAWAGPFYAIQDAFGLLPQATRKRDL